MANFFIQTDKPFYFAGDTVNGQLFVNVGTLIVGAQGLTLKFTGYECVKWVQARQLHRPTPRRDQHGRQIPQFDPIAAIPPHLLVDSNNLDISDCESEENNERDFRPQYIRTSSNRYYEMRYYETRNMFTRNKTMIYNCSGFPPGQYSFPFSFKTFEGWPASFSHHTPKKKGIIIYHMTAAIEPQTRQFSIKGSRQIVLRQTRVVQAQQRSSQGAITSCCCISKGFTVSTMSFAKDGFCPGQLVQMIIEIDNTHCSANITTISISVNNTVTLRSQGHATSDPGSFFNKQINGVYAGQSLVGENAIKEQFVMPNTVGIKPTCSGKLLSCQYSLNIRLHHDITCSCCSQAIGSGIPIIIFPAIPVYTLPPVFQNNWTPQVMPLTNLVLPNNFNNFNLNNLPPPVQPNPLNVPQQNPMNVPQQNPMNNPPPPPPPQQFNQGPQQYNQGPPPPQYNQGPPPQQFNQGPPPPQYNQGPPPQQFNEGPPPPQYNQGPPPQQFNEMSNMGMGNMNNNNNMY